MRPKDSYSSGSSGAIKALEPFLEDPSVTRSGIQDHAKGFITPPNLSDIVGLTRVVDCCETTIAIASRLATAKAGVVTPHAVHGLQGNDIVCDTVHAGCPSFVRPMGSLRGFSSRRSRQSKQKSCSPRSNHNEDSVGSSLTGR